MTKVGKPKVEYRPAITYLGIRTQVPMKGMFQVVGKVHKELATRLERQEVEPAGPPFLRYYVKTEMTVREPDYTTEEAVEIAIAGLAQCLDKMATAVART